MTPSKVHFTGLEFDPLALADRWHRGVIPLHWHKVRFAIPIQYPGPVQQLNRWLTTHIEGRWAIYLRTSNRHREVMIAFEKLPDSVVFVLSDGQNDAFKEEMY